MYHRALPVPVPMPLPIPGKLSNFSVKRGLHKVYIAIKRMESRNFNLNFGGKFLKNANVLRATSGTCPNAAPNSW